MADVPPLPDDHPGELQADEVARAHRILDLLAEGNYEEAAALEAEQVAVEAARTGPPE